ncbi:DUF3987 domain-containing protein [Methylocaldum sp.]|uniref:DUF3987 domain-containing protein n=1 Tax=Methylocaldum sp. TaxID=1969727 RepID=UPI002D48A90B|nr:DUF3987 domain-containing protein [Methylocaldum sp.]HYE38164.1 DUF3987 domain-containing protein [Methylocaldum sp.]
MRNHENWLKAFIEYASFGEAPLKMLFWTGVSTVCGALRRRVWLDMKYFQWVPNMYIVMVAPPGIVSKSTTANVGMNLLRRVDGIVFGPDVVTWQALVESMAKSTELVLDKTTGEYLPMSCITIASDEFGNFLNPDDREMVDVLVSLWDGKRGSFTKTTKMSGNDLIENPWINLIACTTPAWISGNFPEYMIGGGFTSRCVFVFADSKRQEIAYPDENVPPNFLAMQGSLIEDLKQIAELLGEMKLTDDAREWGRVWYTNHWQNPPTGLNLEQFGGYLARKQTLIHKLAMVVSAAQRNTLEITAADLEFSAESISALEQDMPKVFLRIGQDKITKGTTDITAYVQAHGRVSKNTLFKHFVRTLSFNDFEASLRGAVQAGFVHYQQQGNEQYVVKGGLGGVQT